MAKYCGAVGFLETVETAEGVWEEKIVEKMYKGDVVKNSRRWENASGTNDNLNINNTIQIIADAFAYSNVGAMRYVRWMGCCWKITNVEIERPRLILTIGGVWNE